MLTKLLLLKLLLLPKLTCSFMIGLLLHGLPALTLRLRLVEEEEEEEVEVVKEEEGTGRVGCGAVPTSQSSEQRIYIHTC